MDSVKQHGLVDRRWFVDAVAACATFGTLGTGAVFGQQPARVAHASSAQVVDRLKARPSFQISVDVGTLDLGLAVAGAALAGGIDIVEMGTPLLKTQGVANVVPAFRKRFPGALLLADMKTMDGGGGEARSVYAGGGNIVDFLALAGVETAKSICATRDEFRRGSRLPTSWCRTRVPPRRRARSRCGWWRRGSTRSGSTCNPTRGAPTRN